MSNKLNSLRRFYVGKLFTMVYKVFLLCVLQHNGLSKIATVSPAQVNQDIASVGIFPSLLGSTTEILVVAVSVVLVLLLYNQPNFACWWQPKEKNPTIWLVCNQIVSAARRWQTGAVSLWPSSKSLPAPHPPFSRHFLCLCHSLSRRFSPLRIKSANPHCNNSGITPPFHCAILALHRHRLLLQSLDTHAAVVKTRGRSGVLQDIKDVTECGPASAADQTDFCAVVLGLARPFVCRVFDYGSHRSVLLCSVAAEVFAAS